VAQFYKVLKADPLGEPWESHGKQNQTFWCQVEGEEWAVSIAKQVPNTITPGQHVYGDLLKARSQKGTDYWKFKSSAVPEGVVRPADSPAQAVAQQAVGHVDMSATQPDWFQPWANVLTVLYKEITGSDSIPGIQVKKTVEPVVEPVDEDTTAIVKEIFPDAVVEPDAPEGL
jgi:hypothetical protein